MEETKITKDNEPEFIGQIIDIFEDNISSRDKNNRSLLDDQTDDEIRIDGYGDDGSVCFAGCDYDDVAKRLRTLLSSWGIEGIQI